MKISIAVAVVFASLLLEAQSSVPLATTGGRGLTEVHGIRVGHHTLSERPTGCTVVLVEGDGAVGGVSQRGGAPGTRETDLLDPVNMVDKVNAIVLAGGSAYGLAAAQGVVRFLEEHGIGWKTSAGVVPIVPSAILIDLMFGGDPKIRPDAACGYAAATAASSGPVSEGNVGAGAGATVGKLGVFPLPNGQRRSAMKGGVGSAAFTLSSGLVVAAIAAVNAVGDVIDPLTGRVVAGARNPDGSLADAHVDSKRRNGSGCASGREHDHRRRCDERTPDESRSQSHGGDGGRWLRQGDQPVAHGR
jgi:L-aminopeptidase/D-esterase-like protein